MKLINLVFFVSTYVLISIRDVVSEAHGGRGRIRARGGSNIKNLIERAEMKSSFFTNNVSLLRNIKRSSGLNMSNNSKEVSPKPQNKPYIFGIVFPKHLIAKHMFQNLEKRSRLNEDHHIESYYMNADGRRTFYTHKLLEAVLRWLLNGFYI